MISSEESFVKRVEKYEKGFYKQKIKNIQFNKFNFFYLKLSDFEKKEKCLLKQIKDCKSENNSLSAEILELNIRESKSNQINLELKNSKASAQQKESESKNQLNFLQKLNEEMENEIELFKKVLSMKIVPDSNSCIFPFCNGEGSTIPTGKRHRSLINCPKTSNNQEIERFLQSVNLLLLNIHTCIEIKKKMIFSKYTMNKKEYMKVKISNHK